jgi:uncharacterized protein
MNSQKHFLKLTRIMVKKQYNIRRLLRNIVLFPSLLTFILVNIVIAIQANRMMYFGDNPQKLPRKKLSEITTSEKILGLNQLKRPVNDSFLIPHDTIHLTSEGFQLESWYAHHDTISRGFALLFHGFGSSKEECTRSATFFFNQGYDVLLTDFRAHGNSSGNESMGGYVEDKDVAVAYRFAESKGAKTIVMWGVSMGAAAILNAVANDSLQPQKIFLDCPYGSFLDGTKGFLRMVHAPESPTAEMMMFWGSVQKGSWAFNNKPTEYAKKVTMPTLLMRGKKDVRVSQAETEAIFQNLATTNKKLVLFEESPHGAIVKFEKEKWESVVKDFLNQ